MTALANAIPLTRERAAYVLHEAFGVWGNLFSAWKENALL